MKKNKIFALTESAVMIALSVILSMIKVIDMPFGGAVTACAMLPIIMVAYHQGTLWGLVTAFVYSLLQLVLGMNSLQFATSTAAILAIIFLDYIFAFVSLGLGGIFKAKFKNYRLELFAGALLSSALRFVFHIISGCTVWAGLSIPNASAFIYSVLYNAAYMIPEIVLTIAGAWYLSRVFDLTSSQIKIIKFGESKKNGLASSICVFLITLDALVAFLYLFQKMQTESGFDITAVKNAEPVVLVTIGSIFVILGIIIFCLSKRQKSEA